MAVNTVAVETGVTQPAPSAPPARSQYTCTRKKHGEDRRVSAAAADSSASLTSGSSPVRGVRRRAVATACADSRSPARPGASLRPSLPRQDRLSALPQPAPQTAGTHDRGGHPQEETRASRPPGAEGRGGLGQARAGRTAGTGEKALPDPSLPRSGGFRRIRTSSFPAAALSASARLAPADRRCPWRRPSRGDRGRARRRFPPQARRGCLGISLRAGFRRFRLLPEVLVLPLPGSSSMVADI
ncbi:uncharacterized protein LOC128817872 [Vidua macroura]|uniref:uncharacterized protein LOC128817872 n=1 Tax=Vidua macroura TaxID=187451 RepID=UPI0023A82260|nr:uncharacterized protein LOC128817872 [Vidua macroura]